MSSLTPLHIVTATDAIAKERAGRRDKPAPREAGPRHVDDRPDMSVYSQSTFSQPSVLLLSFDLGFARYLASNAISSADQDYSYEAILLGPGEKKIEVEVDTRESPKPTNVEIERATLLTPYPRSSLGGHLHLPQGRPHPRQHASLSSPED